MTLALIFVQDMKARAVSWVLFPLLTVLFLVFRLSVQPSDVVLLSATNSVLFVVVQLFVLSVWFSLRERRWVNITHSLLGLGDVLFLLACCFLFPVWNFLLFYVMSLCIAVFYGIIRGRERQRIPLAGLQAMLLGIILCFDWCYLHIGLTEDSWILKLLLS